MISQQTGSGRMAFAADSPVLLVLVITAEFLSGIFSAKRLFLLRELNHMEDAGTLSQRSSLPILALGLLLLFLPPCKWLNSLRLIWLMFSLILRRTLHNFLYHELFSATFWIIVFKLSSRWFCKRQQECTTLWRCCIKTATDPFEIQEMSEISFLVSFTPIPVD